MGIYSASPRLGAESREGNDMSAISFFPAALPPLVDLHIDGRRIVTFDAGLELLLPVLRFVAKRTKKKCALCRASDGVRLAVAKPGFSSAELNAPDPVAPPSTPPATVTPEAPAPARPTQEAA